MKTITTSEINDCFITANWGARAEEPKELATRFLKMLESFKKIDPLLNQWVYGRKTKLDTLSDDFVKFIAKTIERDDWNVVMPEAGYWFGAMSPNTTPTDKFFVVRSHSGSSLNRPYENSVILTEGTVAQPAPEMHSPRIFRPALLAIADAWDPTIIEANCHGLVQLKKHDDLLIRPAWMRYLCPALAREAQPPASAIVEHLPNGGILLSATDQTFNVDNPRHVAVAEEIAVALAHIDLPTTALHT